MKAPRVLSQLTHDLPEEGQLVVYDNRGEKLVVLNDFGAAVYLLINGERTADEIASFISSTLSQKSIQACESEVRQFLGELASEGIVEWSDFTDASLTR